MGRIRRILIFGGGDTHTDATPMVKVERRLLTWYAQRLGRLVWASERLRLAWNTDRLGLSVDARVRFGSSGGGREHRDRHGSSGRRREDARGVGARRGSVGDAEGQPVYAAIHPITCAIDSPFRSRDGSTERLSVSDPSLVHHVVARVKIFTVLLVSPTTSVGVRRSKKCSVPFAFW